MPSPFTESQANPTAASPAHAAEEVARAPRRVRCSRGSTPTARAGWPTSRRSDASRATARTSLPRSRRSPPGDGSSRNSRACSSCSSSRAPISLSSGSSSATTALPYDAIAIVAIVMLNATLGFVQESRAEQAVAALRAMSAPRRRSCAMASAARARPRARAGRPVLVEEGDTVPADARLIESTALQAAEASLTGESLPVHKSVDAARRRARSATASTCCSAARPSPTGADAPSSTATGTRPRWDGRRDARRVEEAETTPLQRELDARRQACSA